MIARFNPTGTHVHKGFLKVMIDLYPEPTDKTYALHHIQVPVIPPEGYQGKVDAEGSPVDQADYDNWVNGLPKIWQLNPALCHFIRIKETSSKLDLTNYLEQVLNPTVIKTIDDSLVLPNSSHLISPLMRNKAALTTEKIVTKDIEGLILSVNTRFAGLILETASGDEGLSIEPQSIDLGPGLITSGSIQAVDTTFVSKSNPANASGTIDTWQFYFYEDATNVEVATFSASGDNLTTRDSELIGSVVRLGPRTFTGLTIDVETGDYGGWFSTTGPKYYNWTGGGFWKLTGDYIPCSNQAFDVGNSSMKLSMYATGTEGGVDYPISLSAGLTASATIDRDVAWDRAMSPGLTEAVSLTRQLAYDRGVNPGLAVAVTIAKSFGRSIVTSAGLTASATVARALAWTRATTSDLTASTNVLKGFGRTVSITADLAASVIIAIQKGFNKAITSDLTASVTILKGWGRTITTAPGLTISVTVLRSMGRTISTAAGLTASVTVARVLAYKRALTPGLKVSATVAYLVAYKRAVSAGLTAAVSLVATFAGAVATHYFISVVANLTASTTISRAMAYQQAVTSDLTAAVTVLKGWGRTIATSAGLTVSVNIVRVFGYVITTAANLVISVTINYCVVLRELIRVPISRIPISRMKIWRRIRSCF